MTMSNSTIRLLLFHLFLLNYVCSAHMAMSEPPPINYKTNPYFNSAKADYDHTAPLSPSGSNYPCRGHLKDLNNPEGQSVRNYSPGGSYDLRFEGGAAHNGGSCQVSLSYDLGSTWTVIKSYIGNCPQPGGGGGFKFKIPSNTPGGKAIFAWTWFNQQGNREMYMNCAVVTIGRGSSRIRRALSGPRIFIANVGNGCSTVAGTDVVFPEPGSDIECNGDSSKRSNPVGTCNGRTYTGGGATGTNGGISPGTGRGGGTYSGGGGGSSSGGNGIIDSGVQGQGCDYWRRQGYICSTASPANPSTRSQIKLLTVGWITAGLLWGIV